jgi:hypothetical protein
MILIMEIGSENWTGYMVVAMTFKLDSSISWFESSWYHTPGPREST